MVNLGIATRPAVVVALCVCLPACYVGLDVGAGDDAVGVDEGGSEGSASQGVAREPESASGQEDGGSGQPPEDESCEESTFAGALSQFVRLTHGQYDNSVRDLLGVEIPVAATFIPDPVVNGFSNNSDALLVTDRLVRDYQRAAEEVAGTLLANPDAIVALVDCDGVYDDACASAFIADFGRRAFRRPLEASEQDAFMRAFAGGAGLYEQGDEFQQGVALVVETALQSPSFLYRTEMSAPPPGETQVALTGYEIASRLSFMFWNSTPDRELLAAAEAGELDSSEGIETHARRLLADPRAADPVRDFHAQWLATEKYASVTKDPELFPSFGADTIAAMEVETEEFFRRMILEENATYADLMTSPVTWITPELAEVYGIEENLQDGLNRVELDPARRAGFLTQSGFLASHAYFASTSPIHRGVGVQRQVLCAVIPDPPGDVDLELPPLDATIKTGREQVTSHTSPDACVGCHKLINEPGFAFEIYDSVGQYRVTDNGEPIDSSGVIPTTDGQLPFTDAVDLAHQLADSPAAQRCYLTQWFRYVSARKEQSADRCTLDAVHEALMANGYNVGEMLVALTQTVNFRFRVNQEDE